MEESEKKVENKEQEQIKQSKLFPGINEELISRITKILDEYPVKEVIFSLWYILMTLNMSILKVFDQKQDTE